ncbi:transposase [Streptomyces smyrnaeus]|uniref:transposase n=1 Tax=Streptomyces smyrnaeus TaxID=1387713 RepID=UPI0036B06002
MASAAAAPAGQQRSLRPAAGSPADDRRGILHRERTGVQWRDLPEHFGPRKTVHERHRLWPADGTRERPLQQFRAEADGAGKDRLGRPGRLHHRADTSAPGRRPHRSTAGSRLKKKGDETARHQGETAWQSLLAHLAEAAQEVRA